MYGEDDVPGVVGRLSEWANQAVHPTPPGTPLGPYV